MHITLATKYCAIESVSIRLLFQGSYNIHHVLSGTTLEARKNQVCKTHFSIIVYSMITTRPRELIQMTLYFPN